MPFEFQKYQGTGNDFIIIDDRDENFDLKNHTLIQNICDRKFGIGSDGLILIRNSKEADFEMIFYNPDASMSFCGNGSRCAVMFCFQNKIISNKNCSFIAIDGIHQASIENDWVKISIGDVNTIKKYDKDIFINTGSPHYIRFVKELNNLAIKTEAHPIRYNNEFKEKGTNVNFVEPHENYIAVRTYERGVEDETLSCGSGVTACAIGAAYLLDKKSPIKIQSQGGELNVSFSQEGEKFTNIFLSGPAKFVFKGTYGS